MADSEGVKGGEQSQPPSLWMFQKQEQSGKKEEKMLYVPLHFFKNPLSKILRQRISCKNVQTLTKLHFQNRIHFKDNVYLK